MVTSRILVLRWVMISPVFEGQLFCSVVPYIQVQNALTFTKYDGMDPEIGFGPEDSNKKSWVSGIDYGYYPRPRTVCFCVNSVFNRKEFYDSIKPKNKKEMMKFKLNILALALFGFGLASCTNSFLMWNRRRNLPPETITRQKVTPPRFGRLL